MPYEPDTSTFDKAKAELFDALGHPIRIKILHVLEDGPLGFSELRRRAGLESNGHLQFHLSKLDGLVKSGPDGAYGLTDDGKEALAFVKMVKVATAKDTADTKAHRTLRNICIAIGAFSIIADVVTVPNAIIGLTYCGSSGAAFCTLPYRIPILAIIGVVMGLASVTMAFASERGASVISSVAAGFALTFVSASGSWAFSSMDVGWPLPWAHQFNSLGGLLQTQPWFYVDVLGLLLDIAFWAAVVFAAISLVRFVQSKHSGPSEVSDTSKEIDAAPNPRLRLNLLPSLHLETTKDTMTAGCPESRN